MDSVGAVELAHDLGLSLSTVHAELDRIGGCERVGRGARRTVPAAAAHQITEKYGAVPEKISGVSRDDQLVLAALMRAPLGVGSARALARRLSLSPTTVARSLSKLHSLGFVRRDQRPQAGTGRFTEAWTVGKGLTLEHRATLRRVELPAERWSGTPQRQPSRVPKQFHHWFWNTANPAALTIDHDGVFVAHRLITQGTFVERDWVLRHLPQPSIREALTIRGVDPATRRLIERELEQRSVNGVFERETKLQFLDASSQQLIAPPKAFASIRVATLEDLMATKLKVIRDRGEARDYFDIMVIEQQAHITVEEGLGLALQKYQPQAPESFLDGIVRGLGYLDDVLPDTSLPVAHADIVSYWVKRSIRI